MSLLVGAMSIGLILSLLALGVYISFRIFAFPDITADGSITLGASIAAVLLIKGYSPYVATIAAFGGGMLAGATTGVLHTRFKINGLLSGILVMTALYSINLHVMGKSNVPLIGEKTLASYADTLGVKAFGDVQSFEVAGWELAARDACILFFSFATSAAVALGMYFFFRTNLGTAMRATGDNQQMARANGINVSNMIILGLALSNGLIALSGALLAQYQGFSDVQMGIGMVVSGLASVIIGEALVGQHGLGLSLTGAIMGSILFRLLVATALRWGLNPNDLKLITAGFVFVALILPGVTSRIMPNRRRPARA